MADSRNDLQRAEEIVVEPIEGDATPCVLAAIKAAPVGAVIRFTGDCYHFHPRRAFEAYYYISNNHHGLKRIAFPLIRKKNLTIDGAGARFVFHGELIPFVLDRSELITLCNFSVDWERPFYSQGVVEDIDGAGVVVRIDPELYPYRFKNRDLIFEGEGWESMLTEGVFAFDPQTRAPAYRSGDSMGLGFTERIDAESAGAGLIRLCERFPNAPELGTLIVFRHYGRHTPAIFSIQSRDLLFESVTLHQAGGMGFISQFCENMALRRCQVTPTEGRIFSVCADASHFVSCRGLIELDGCLFENQLDDPLNVHGLNARIEEVLDRRTLLLERVHHEQYGVALGFPGDAVQFSDNQTLLSYGESWIESVETINGRYVKVRFQDDLPEFLCPGHVVENMSWTPDLTVGTCTVRNNRARGLLISTPGKVLVEGNRISAAGSGIKISGDANYWFESGAVRDVCIRDNDFGECCYGDASWGCSVINIDPEIADPESSFSCFHRNIRIEGNRFATSDKGMLFARSVEGLRFTGNSILRTGFYPEGRMSRSVTIDACQDVCIENNQGLDSEAACTQAPESSTEAV